MVVINLSEFVVLLNKIGVNYKIVYLVFIVLRYILDV